MMNLLIYKYPILMQIKHQELPNKKIYPKLEKPHPQNLDIVCPHQKKITAKGFRAANFHDFLKARRRTYGPQSSRPELSVFFTSENVISRQLTRSLE